MNEEERVASELRSISQQPSLTRQAVEEQLQQQVMYAIGEGDMYLAKQWREVLVTLVSIAIWILLVMEATNLSGQFDSHTDQRRRSLEMNTGFLTLIGIVGYVTIAANLGTLVAYFDDTGRIDCTEDPTWMFAAVLWPLALVAGACYLGTAPSMAYVYLQRRKARKQKLLDDLADADPLAIEIEKLYPRSQEDDQPQGGLSE